MVDLHSQIKAVRKHLSLTQSEFAEKIHISRDLLAQIETNKSQPTITTIYSIVSNFHINFEWLIAGTGSMLKDSKDTNKYKITENEQLISEPVVEYNNNVSLINYLRNEVEQLKRSISIKEQIIKKLEQSAE